MSSTADHEPHAATAVVQETLQVQHTTTSETKVDTDLSSTSTTRTAVQITTVVAVSVVAAVAAVVSFMHMYELAVRAGEGWRAWLVPLAIDGLVVAASMTMVVRRRAGRRAGWLAWISLTLGIAASLAANIAAAEPTLIGRAVAAWPPIALLLAYELLMSQIQVASKNPVAQGIAHPAVVPSVAVPQYAQSTAHDRAAVPPNTAPAAMPRQDGTPSTTTGPDNSQNAADVSALTPVLVAVPDRDESSSETVRHTARQRYLKTVADGLPCTGRELADMFGMSERWGRYQVRAARRTLTTADSAPRPGS
jgi:hypothetical protein